MVWEIALSYAVIIAAGVGSYYVYTRWVPTTWRASVAGWKTNALGGLVSVSPDILNLLTSVHMLAESWEPSEMGQWMMRGIGIAIIVLRFVTTYEQKEEL